MVSLQIEHRARGTLRTPAAAWFLPEGRLFRKELATLKEAFPDCAHAFTSSPFRGKFQEVLKLFPRGGKIKCLLAVGIGDPSKLDAERLRRASTTAVRAAQEQKSPSLVLLEPSDAIIAASPEARPDRTALALLEGAVLAAYRYDRYRTREKKKVTPLVRFTFVTDRRSRVREIRPVVSQVRAVCGGTWLARDLENAPGNEIYPETLARRARAAGQRAGFGVRVLEIRALRRIGMGGLLAVSGVPGSQGL